MKKTLLVAGLSLHGHILVVLPNHLNNSSTLKKLDFLDTSLMLVK